jgi:hypothetical protein
MRETFCFVVMPFRPELNYFYLYLKKYLEEKYKIRVERGDSHVLTKELMKKISDQISAASFLLADITGSNANYFSNWGSRTPRASRSFFSLKTMFSEQASTLLKCMRSLAISFGSSTPKADSTTTRLLARSFTPMSSVPRRRKEFLNSTIPFASLVFFCRGSFRMRRI